MMYVFPDSRVGHVSSVRSINMLGVRIILFTSTRLMIHMKVFHDWTFTDSDYLVYQCRFLALVLVES